MLVLAFSKDSLWNSMVDRVPSICFSCFSRRFFALRAFKAAVRIQQTDIRTIKVIARGTWLEIFISTQLDGFTRNLNNLVTNRYSKSLEQS